MYFFTLTADKGTPYLLTDPGLSIQQVRFGFNLRLQLLNTTAPMVFPYHSSGTTWIEVACKLDGVTGTSTELARMRPVAFYNADIDRLSQLDIVRVRLGHVLLTEPIYNALTKHHRLKSQMNHRRSNLGYAVPMVSLNLQNPVCSVGFIITSNITPHMPIHRIEA